VIEEDRSDFADRVEKIVACIVDNPFVGAAFGIRMPAVGNFIERNASALVAERQ
jgi:hypothetical protein